MSRSHLLRSGLFVLLVAYVGLEGLSPGRAQTSKGKKYALLVGVAEYRHDRLTPLKGTENDVEELAKVLRRPSCGFTSVRILTTTRGKKNSADAPTAENINKELVKLREDKGADDLVLIGLSGHGADVEVSDPDGKDKPKTYTYFFPSDADFEKISYSTGISKRLVSLGDLFARLERCGAGSKLVLIDACRNKIAAESSTRMLTPDRVTVPDGVGALFSCGPGQVSLETGFDVDGRRVVHGVFFYHVLEGLRGGARNVDGTVNWDDLNSHVRRRVPAYVQTTLRQKEKQVPHGVNNAKNEAVLVQAQGGGPGEEKFVKGAKEITNSIGMKLVRIPAGTFTMGSAEKERLEAHYSGGGKKYPDWLKPEGPQHEVEITRTFYFGVHEVTQEQYQKVMGKTPSWFSAYGGGKDKVHGMDTSKFPVEQVSWDEAVEFCWKLSHMPAEMRVGRKYRLPTEAEWEYACRSGARTSTAFHFG